MTAVAAAPGFDLTATLDLLERTPAVLDRLLRGTDRAWNAIDEGPETWRAIDVVGHLIHGEETDWLPRARFILEHGEARPFEPFDRTAMLRRFADWPIERLLDRFAQLRRLNLEIVRDWRLTGEELDRTGRHPELGRVSLRQLLAAWATHDLSHLAQIARVMAKRHAEAVGPWHEYLGVLHR